MLLILPLSGRKLRYLEEFYRMYYLPSQFESNDLQRNIFWLQIALKAPFAPPLYALVISEKETEYKKYQKLLQMHINYLLTKNLVYLAARFDKHKPVFFNKPYAKDIVRSLAIAKFFYEGATFYWKKVTFHYQDLTELKEFKTVKTKLNFAEHLIYRIYVKDLDYQRIIDRKLTKLTKTYEYFKQELTEEELKEALANEPIDKRSLFKNDPFFTGELFKHWFKDNFFTQEKVENNN